MSKVTNTQLLNEVKSTNAQIAELTKSINALVKTLTQQPKSGNGSKASKPSPASATPNKPSSPKKGKGKKATVSFEERMKEWNEKRENYMPSTKLINAIKRDRASITLEVAKTKSGFIGTKKDLAWLKLGVEEGEY